MSRTCGRNPRLGENPEFNVFCACKACIENLGTVIVVCGLLSQKAPHSFSKHLLVNYSLVDIVLQVTI